MNTLSLIVAPPTIKMISHDTILTVNEPNQGSGDHYFTYPKTTTLNVNWAVYASTLEVFSTSSSAPGNLLIKNGPVLNVVDGQKQTVLPSELNIFIENGNINYFTEVPTIDNANLPTNISISIKYKHSFKIKLPLNVLTSINVPAHLNLNLSNDILTGMVSFTDPLTLPFTNGSIILIPTIGDNR